MAEYGIWVVDWLFVEGIFLGELDGLEELEGDGRLWVNSVEDWGFG